MTTDEIIDRLQSFFSRKFLTTLGLVALATWMATREPLTVEVFTVWATFCGAVTGLYGAANVAEKKVTGKTL